MNNPLYERLKAELTQHLGTPPDLAEKLSPEVGTTESGQKQSFLDELWRRIETKPTDIRS